MSYQEVSTPETYVAASPSKTTNQGRMLASVYCARGSPVSAPSTAGNAVAVASFPAALRFFRYVAYSTSVCSVSVGLPSSTVPGMTYMMTLPASDARPGQAFAFAASSRLAWPPSRSAGR